MSTDEPRERTVCEPVPSPGTPGYQEHFERTGQAAMDATLAHPISRFVFGFFAIGLVWLWVEIVREAIMEYSLVWAVLWIVGWTIVVGPIIREVGSVALFGKPRSRWFAAMVRRNGPNADSK